MNTWREGVNFIQKRIEVALNNQPDVPHDVFFIVGKENTEMSCHKLILTIASPVFRQMFSHQQTQSECSTNSVFSDANAKDSVLVTYVENVKYNGDELRYKRRIIADKEIINLPEIDPIGFGNLIQYMYKGKLDINFEESYTTMHCAVLYEIPELIEHCLQVLTSRDFNYTNVIGIYQAAEYCNHATIRDDAFKFIKMNSAVLLDSKMFLTFSERNLHRFLYFMDCMPDLNSEIQIFNAVLNWARHKCEKKGLQLITYNLRCILEKLLTLVRFPAMNVDEFNEIVVPSGILTSKECMPLYKYFTSSEKKRLTVYKELKYPCNSRRPLQTFSFFNEDVTNTFNTWSDRGYDTLCLNEGSGNLILRGFGVVLPENFWLTQMIRFSVWDETHRVWLISCEQTLTECLAIGYLKFDHGVTIHPRVKYCVCVNFDNKVYDTVVSNPVTIVQYSKDMLGTSTFNWSNADDQKCSFTFTPYHCIAWGLQFQQ